MKRLEAAKLIVEHDSCMGHDIECNDCPAFDIVRNRNALGCTLNWDKEDKLSGNEYEAAKKEWFENWIKNNS